MERLWTTYLSPSQDPYRHHIMLVTEYMKKHIEQISEMTDIRLE
jgi:hypothetical protein